MAVNESGYSSGGGKKYYGDERSGLLYRTRGDSDPYGKPKVYFACHPADLPLYLDEIAADLFRTQNCVICYRDPDRTYTEQDLRELLTGRFALFVFPVTYRLLTEPSQALDIELPCALSLHIPVLPLLQEDGLDQLFEEKCGTLQYLNKNARDHTAISFDTKLKGFLERTLFGDREAEMIRKAFAAYIFLSYRKKDRQYAQELMKLIHRHERFRDVAVWYDEFLIPGESFPEAIEKILLRSDLFLLAVTPNLAREQNYVSEVEYPEAVRAGRDIVPAEMEPLTPQERASLRTLFPGLPDITRAEDREMLYARLTAFLGKVLFRLEPDDSLHRFCIGLAYLKGIDTEVDHARALTLITEAANLGLPEAMQKLGHMYTAGEGVARDFALAVHWYEKHASALREAWRNTPSAEAAQSLFRSLQALEEAYLRAGRKEDAIRTCDEEIRLARGSGDPWASPAAGEALLNRGYYAYEKLDFVTADQCYDEAEAVFRRCGMNFELAMVLERRSLLKKRTGDTGGAAACLESALRLREQDAGPGAAPRVRSSVALTSLLLGDLYARSDVSRARGCYTRALELYTGLAAETRSVRDRDGLAVCLCALAEISSGETQRDYWKKALEILTVLAEQTGSRALNLKKTICEINLKGVLNVDVTGLLPEKASEEELIRRHKDQEEQARANTAGGRHRDAAVLWRKAFDTVQEIIRRFSDAPENYQVLYLDALRAGRAFMRAGDPEEAEACFELVWPEARRQETRFRAYLIDRDESARVFCSVCAEACMSLAQLSDDAETVSTLCDECLQELHRIHEAFPGTDSLYDLAKAYRMAGALELLEDADIYLEEARRFCAMGLKQEPGHTGFLDLQKSFEED